MFLKEIGTEKRGGVSNGPTKKVSHVISNLYLSINYCLILAIKVNGKFPIHGDKAIWLLVCLLLYQY